MSEDPQGEVKLFGARVPAEKERKFLLIAGAVGILGFAYIVLKGRASGAALPSSTGQSTSAGTAGSGGTSGSSGAGASALPPGQDIELKFSESTSPSLEYQSASGHSGSGGFGISIPGLGGLNFGGSSGGTGSNHTKLGVENVFSTDVVIHNSDAGTLASIEAWLTGLAGTQEQRANQAQQEINQAVLFTDPGHTAGGIISHEQAQQALENAKIAAQIAKIKPPIVHNPLSHV